MSAESRGPVVLIHLEDPPDTGRAACSGQPFSNLPDDHHPQVPRVLCPGCTRVGLHPRKGHPSADERWQT